MHAVFVDVRNVLQGHDGLIAGHFSFSSWRNKFPSFFVSRVSEEERLIDKGIDVLYALELSNEEYCLGSRIQYSIPLSLSRLEYT